MNDLAQFALTAHTARSPRLVAAGTRLSERSLPGWRRSLWPSRRTARGRAVVCLASHPFVLPLERAAAGRPMPESRGAGTFTAGLMCLARGRRRTPLFVPPPGPRRLRNHDRPALGWTIWCTGECLPTARTYSSGIDFPESRQLRLFETWRRCRERVIAQPLSLQRLTCQLRRQSYCPRRERGSHGRSQAAPRLVVRCHESSCRHRYPVR